MTTKGRTRLLLRAMSRRRRVGQVVLLGLTSTLTILFAVLAGITAAGGQSPTTQAQITGQPTPETPYTNPAGPSCTGNNTSPCTLNDGEYVDVTLSAGSFDTSGGLPNVAVLECADPGGDPANLPTSVDGSGPGTGCDTVSVKIFPATVNGVQTDGSFNTAAVYHNLSHDLVDGAYQVNALPYNTDPNSAITCDATNYCVLFVGLTQSDFTQTHYWSVPFLIPAGANDTTTTTSSTTTTTTLAAPTTTSGGTTTTHAPTTTSGPTTTSSSPLVSSTTTSSPTTSSTTTSSTTSTTSTSTTTSSPTTSSTTTSSPTTSSTTTPSTTTPGTTTLAGAAATTTTGGGGTTTTTAPMPGSTGSPTGASGAVSTTAPVPGSTGSPTGASGAVSTTAPVPGSTGSPTGASGAVTTTAPPGATGSGPTGPSPGSAGLPDGFSVVTHDSLGSSGGTVTATVGSASVTVSVLPGTFSSPTDVVVLEGSANGVPSLAGHDTVVVIAISIERNGQKVTGTLANPVSVTITDPSIQDVDELLVYDPSSGAYEPTAESTTISDISVSTGALSLDILADPAVAVVSPPASSPAGGTTVRSPSGVVSSPVSSNASSGTSPVSSNASSGTSPVSGSSNTSGPSAVSGGDGSSPAAVSVGGLSPGPDASNASGQTLAYTGPPVTLLIWLLCAGCSLVATGVVGRRLVRSRAR